MVRVVGPVLVLTLLLAPAVLAVVGPGPFAPAGASSGPGADAAAEPELCFRAVNGITGNPVPELVITVRSLSQLGYDTNTALSGTPLVVTDRTGTAIVSSNIELGLTYLVEAVDPWAWYAPLTFGLEPVPGCLNVQLRMQPSTKPLPLTVDNLRAVVYDQRLQAGVSAVRLAEDPSASELTVFVVTPGQGSTVVSVPFGAVPEAPSSGAVCVLPDVVPPVPVGVGNIRVIGIEGHNQSCVVYKEGEVCAVMLGQLPGTKRYPVQGLTPFGGVSLGVNPLFPYFNAVTGEDDGTACRTEPDDEGAVGYLRGIVQDGSVRPEFRRGLGGINVTLQLVGQFNELPGVSVDLNNPPEQVAGAIPANVKAILASFGQVPVPPLGRTTGLDVPGVEGQDANALPFLAVRRAYESFGLTNFSDHRDDRYRYADVTGEDGSFRIACHRLGDLTPGNGLSVALSHQPPDGTPQYVEVAQFTDCKAGAVLPLSTQVLRREVTLQGVVREITAEGATLGPLGDVRVALAHDRLLSTSPVDVTGADGRYELRVPWNATAEGAFALTATRPAYKTYQNGTIGMGVDDLAQVQVPFLNLSVAGLEASLAGSLGTFLTTADGGYATSTNLVLTSLRTAIDTAVARPSSLPQQDCNSQTEAVCTQWAAVAGGAFQTVENLVPAVESQVFNALEQALAACETASAQVPGETPAVSPTNNPPVDDALAQAAAAATPVTDPAFATLQSEAAPRLAACHAALQARLSESAGPVGAFNRALFGAFRDQIVDAMEAQADPAWETASLDSTLAGLRAQLLTSCPAPVSLPAPPAPLGPPAGGLYGAAAGAEGCLAAADLVGFAADTMAGRIGMAPPSERPDQALVAFDQAYGLVLSAGLEGCRAQTDLAAVCPDPVGALRLALASEFQRIRSGLAGGTQAVGGFPDGGGQEAFFAWLRGRDAAMGMIGDLREALDRYPRLAAFVEATRTAGPTGAALDQVRLASVLLVGGDTTAAFVAQSLASATSAPLPADLGPLGHGGNVTGTVYAEVQSVGATQATDASRRLGVQFLDIDLERQPVLRRVVDVFGQPVAGACVRLAPAESCLPLIPGGFVGPMPPGDYPQLTISAPGFTPKGCDVSVPPRITDLPESENIQCWVMVRSGRAAVQIQALDQVAEAYRAEFAVDLEVGLCAAKVQAFADAARVTAPLAEGAVSCSAQPAGSWRSGLVLDGLPEFTNGTAVLEVPGDTPVFLGVAHPAYAQPPATPLTLAAGRLHDLRGTAQALVVPRDTRPLDVVPFGTDANDTDVIEQGVARLAVNNTALDLPGVGTCSYDDAKDAYACGPQPWLDDLFGLRWPAGEYRFTFAKPSSADGGLIYPEAEVKVDFPAPPFGSLLRFEQRFPWVPALGEARVGRIVDAHIPNLTLAGIPDLRVKVANATCVTNVHYTCEAMTEANGSFSLRVPSADLVLDLGLNSTAYNLRSTSIAAATGKAGEAALVTALNRTSRAYALPVRDLHSGALMTNQSVTIELLGPSGEVLTCAPDTNPVRYSCANTTSSTGLANLVLPWGTLRATVPAGRSGVFYRATLDPEVLTAALAPIPDQNPLVFDEADFLGANATEAVVPGVDPTVRLDVPRRLETVRGVVLNGTADGPGLPGATVNARPSVWPAGRSPEVYCDPRGDQPLCRSGVRTDRNGTFTGQVPDANIRLLSGHTNETGALLRNFGNPGTLADTHAYNQANGLAAGNLATAHATAAYLVAFPEAWRVNASAPGFTARAQVALDPRVGAGPYCTGPPAAVCEALEAQPSTCLSGMAGTGISLDNDLCPQDHVQFVLLGLIEEVLQTVQVQRVTPQGSTPVGPGVTVCVGHPMESTGDLANPGDPSGRAGLLLRALLLRSLGAEGLFANAEALAELANQAGLPTGPLPTNAFPSDERCLQTNATGAAEFRLKYHPVDPRQNELGAAAVNLAYAYVPAQDNLAGFATFEVRNGASEGPVTVPVLDPVGSVFNALEGQQVGGCFGPNLVAANTGGDVCSGTEAESRPRRLTARWVSDAGDHGPVRADWAVITPTIGSTVAKQNTTEVDLAADPADGDRADGTWTVVLWPQGASPVAGAKVQIQLETDVGTCRSSALTSQGLGSLPVEGAPRSMTIWQVHAHVVPCRQAIGGLNLGVTAVPGFRYHLPGGVA